jgi:hypothetical protein
MADTTTTNYGWVKPTVNADLNLWGGLLNTNLDNQDSTVHGIDVMARAAAPIAGAVFTGPVVTTNTLTIGGVAGTSRVVYFNTGAPGAGLHRWGIFTSTEAENGTNTGSNFAIQRMDDTGATIDNPLSINRATGAVTIPNNLVVNGSITGVTGGVLASFNGRTTPAVVLTGGDVNNAVGFAIQSAAGAAIGTSGGTVPLLNTNLTFSGSVNHTGPLTAGTPPSGDWSSNVATTAFVWSRGWQSSGQQVINTSTTLNDGYAGSDLLVGGGITITFPPSSRTFILSNVGQPFVNQDTLLAFTGPGPGTDFRGVLHAGEKVVLCGDGNGYWRLMAAANLQDPRLTGLPITSSGGDHTIGPTDYGGCVHLTANGSVYISTSMPIGTVVEISCDAGAQAIIRYTAGTLRTVPANSTANNAVMNGPGSTFIEQKKATEIWARGDAV